VGTLTSDEEGEAAMEVLSSRVLLRPVDFERSAAFYRETLGLGVYREWRGGVVFFLGGGFLELSGRAGAAASDKVSLWLQVRDVDAVHAELTASSSIGSVEVVEEPVDEPWGLREMRIRDPDGVLLVVVEVPPEHPLRRGQD
jgi:catechol 2,3-dioxygenase-like lactoylglutathione lyase family enzyme